MNQHWRLKSCLVGCLVVANLAPAWAAPGPSAPAARFNPIQEMRFLNAMTKGKEAYDHKDYAASEMNFRKAAQIRPDSSEALNDLGASLYRAGRFGEAQQSFERAGAGARPDSLTLSKAAYQAGNSLYRQKKLPEAAEQYRKALRWNEQDDDARHNLQVVLDQLRAQQPKEQKSEEQKPKEQKPKQQKPGEQKPKEQNKEKGNKPKDSQDKSSQAQAKPEPKPEPKSESGKDKVSQAGQGQRKDAPHEPDQPSGKTPNGESGKRPADKPSAPQGQPPTRSASGQPQNKEAERILQYFQNKERQTRRRPAGTVAQPQPGQETW